MNRYRVHIESDCSNAVPRISAFLLLAHSRATGSKGASKYATSARLEEVSTGIGEAIQAPCYICEKDEEPLTVLLTVSEFDSSTSTSIEYDSVCPSCLASLQGEIIPVLTMEAFEQRVRKLERAVSKINLQ